jgi:hypothetical protein
MTDVDPFWLRPENIEKNITPFILFSALMEVPEGCVLVKNGVGNLSIIRINDRKWLGFIDLRTGEVTRDGDG